MLRKYRIVYTSLRYVGLPPWHAAWRAAVVALSERISK